MVSLCLTPAEESPAQAEEPVAPPVIVASFGSAVAADYAVRVAPSHVVDLSCTETPIIPPAASCVLFLEPRLTEAQRRALDAFVARLGKATYVGVVSSFRVHFDDAHAAALEAAVLERLRTSSACVVVFRPGLMAQRILQRFGPVYPLVPARFRSVFVEHEELFAAIDASSMQERTRHRQVITLLGANRSWREMLRERGPRGVLHQIAIALCWVLACLLVGQLTGLLFDLLVWLRPTWRRWNFDTLRPTSFAELLALCNRFNHQHLKIVGYNNGVNHFGQRHPNRTIVSTIHLQRVRRTSGNTIKVDCGTTIRRARDLLRSENQELYVLPNYSYVCLGTAFFIPIHGSASDYATVAETFFKVLLYDPSEDRFILATSNEPAFRDTVYNLASHRIVLRLWMRVKPKSAYFALHQNVANPDAGALLAALRDQEAANVEIRKANGRAPDVTISKYYLVAAERSDLVEVPRDGLGRLWDRLEENPLTSFLMHWFARTMIWHVEVFFSEAEFVEFWKTHGSLPLRKIQLRSIRRDGLPHSPFRDHDCVSVDVFVFRWNRMLFEAYLRKTFGVVRTNPGKHTR